MEKVIVQLAGEHFNIVVKKHGRKGMVMLITSNVSKMRVEITDKGEMLSKLTHYEKYGTVVSGEFNLVRQFIKGGKSDLFSVEEYLTFNTGLLN